MASGNGCGLCKISVNKIGVRKGDVVTVLMPNTPKAVISIYALNRLGAVSNIVHPLSAQEEIKNYLVSCKCKFLLCIDKCIKKIENIKEETYLEKSLLQMPLALCQRL